MKTLSVCTIFLVVCFNVGPGQTRNAPQAPADSIFHPIDPQQVQDQQTMTWDDYHPIPHINWADSVKPARQFRMALVAIDFPDQPFVITLPKKTDLYGNPQIDPITRPQVGQFYADFYNKPSPVNHGHTINGYWMEQSRGKFGIAPLDAYGPFRMPKDFWEYGLNEYGQNDATPTGGPASGRMERDCDSLWHLAVGEKKYDAVLRIYAGYDETGVWQEFGEMKFQTKEDIPSEWGSPNPAKPRWVVSRYVPWTSWRAGASQWGLSSIRQGENSGTITHELGHYAFRIGDNNNNPYVRPYRRAGSGPWDMMDRGSFNGPGGPHSRWEVPAIAGASMPAGLMLRNRLKNGFLTASQVLTLSRDGLAKSGLAVARVTARAVAPLPGTFAGIIVRLDGKAPQDRTPADDPATDPLSPGIPDYNFYSMEVVQRIGYDSFTPDNGVLIAKNKDKEGRNGGSNGFNCFNWVIDAHPEDIHEVDYVKPDRTPVMRTIADYRQLNDALFHAGMNSGSQYEYQDTPNRLNFYVIDLQKNADGILSYTLGVKSLDGSGAQRRGVEVTAPPQEIITGEHLKCEFTVKNTGSPASPGSAIQPGVASEYFNVDIIRLSVSIEGQGWNGQLENALVSIKPGEERSVAVYVWRTSEAASRATVTVKAVSESDGSKKSEARVEVVGE